MVTVIPETSSLDKIFAITGPERESSFAHLDLNHYRTSPEGITFTLMQTKTAWPDEPVVDRFIY